MIGWLDQTDMKWKSPYSAFAILSLCALFFYSCGTRKKQVERTRVDSVYYSRDIVTERQASTLTQTVSTDLDLNLNELELKITDYDTAGRITRETVAVQRQETRKEVTRDTMSKDTVSSIQALKIDSGRVEKKQVSKAKDSDTSLLKNIGQFTLIILGALAIAAVFLYKWLKR